MLSLLTLLLGGVVAAPAEKAEPPAKKELFANENWYKNQKGKEETFEGTLEFKEQKGVGFGRYNPYRLVMKNDAREVYVGSQGKLLQPYIGKRIRLIGKAVDMEVEGRNHREIWAARLEVITEEKPKEAPEAAALAADGKEVKILARAFWPHGRMGKVAQLWVIRSGDELVVATGVRANDKDGTVKKQALDAMAKALKVDTIDFDKHMLVAVGAGAKPTGGYRVEITKANIDDVGKAMTVHWKLHSPKPGDLVTQAFTYPAEVILVQRFHSVRVDPALPKENEKERPAPPPGTETFAAAVAEPAKTKEVKIAARAPMTGKISPPKFNDPGEQRVIRSAEELEKATGSKQGVERLVLLLKTGELDFKKQMLIQVTGGTKSSGGYRMEITKIEVDDAGKTMTVHWKLHAPQGFATSAITHPGEVVLIDRFDGEVKFVPAK